MAECKWCKDEFCVNADCPMVADYCPVPNDEGVCRYEERITEQKTTLREVIEDTPTADVVEVVRCKDCIYKTVTKDGEYNPEDIVCEYHMSDGFDSDDYCSYGERKDDKND